LLLKSFLSMKAFHSLQVMEMAIGEVFCFLEVDCSVAPSVHAASDKLDENSGTPRNRRGCRC
jgi:hypothetical protein